MEAYNDHHGLAKDPLASALLKLMGDHRRDDRPRMLGITS
jgi:hypothetical protein